MPSPITCGSWTVHTIGRGGSPIRAEIPYTSFNFTRTLNTSTAGRLTMPVAGESRAACCEAVRESEPFRDELAFFRDNDPEPKWVGPLIDINSNPGSAFAQSLFRWMEERFIEDLHADGDVEDIFRTIFLHAYEREPSANITLSTRTTGIQATRDYQEVEFQRAADALRELARTGIDFTEIERTILAGGTELWNEMEPLVLHDEGVLTGDLVKEGSNLATDVAVFGANPTIGTPTQSKVIIGRAVTGDDTYGLIQKSFTELQVRDTPSADANALARVESMQPAPRRIRVTLSDKAGFEFDDLIAGRRVDARLSSAIGCGEVDDIMRLQTVIVNGSEAGEKVDLDLVPLGVMADA